MLEECVAPPFAVVSLSPLVEAFSAVVPLVDGVDAEFMNFVMALRRAFACFLAPGGGIVTSTRLKVYRRSLLQRTFKIKLVSGIKKSKTRKFQRLLTSKQFTNEDEYG